MKNTREERLNNPMGLKKSLVVYYNEIQPSSDPAFKEFPTMQDGIRAGVMNFLAYFRHHNCRTVRQIIDRWAPSEENDTEAYIDAVCQEIGAQPDEELDLTQQDEGFGLAAAICRHENGELPCSAEEILEGVKDAYETVYKRLSN